MNCGIVHDEQKCRKSYARAKVLEQVPRSKTGEKKENPLDFSAKYRPQRSPTGDQSADDRRWEGSTEKEKRKDTKKKCIISLVLCFLLE